METFSGHHMKICSINHCCPVKQKSNHRWGHALSKFLMHGNYEAGCVPAQGNQTCHIPRGACARTGRSLLGKLLAGGTGDAHTACTGAQHFQCTSRPGKHSALLWDWKPVHCSGLPPLQEPLAWGEQRGHVQQPPWQFGACLASAAKRRMLLPCQYWLRHLPFNAHIDDVMKGWTINYFIIR